MGSSLSTMERAGIGADRRPARIQIYSCSLTI